MKQLSRKQKAQRRNWLLAQCERLRQECNHMTDKQRREAQEKALQIIYGVSIDKKPTKIKRKALEDPEPEVRDSARAALSNLRSRWHFQPVDFNAVQDAIATNAVLRLRGSGLLPYEERNDASIIAEAAILNCALLVSRDS